MESPLRSHMPVAGRYAYFDHAAVAPIPAGSAAAMATYAQQSSASGDVHWLEWAAKLEELRSLAAELLNVQAVELALTANTTQGINFVVEGFPWKPGDNVVVPENEFPSNFLPWQSLDSRGVELRRVPVPESGRLTADSFAALLDQRTRMISLSWVGFASGFRVDVAKVVEMAHRRGVLVMLDAIQGLGAFPLDLAGLGIDFLAADGHKWMLGPEGAGLFFIKQEHLNLLRPVGLGWNSLATGAFEPGATDIKASAERYEGGTLNMPGFHALLASLKLLKAAGLNDSRVAHAILESVGMIAESLRDAGFEVLMPPGDDVRSGILGTRWPEAQEDPQLLVQARKFLLKQGVVTSVRSGRIRISAHAYNNILDAERLVHSLAEFRHRQERLAVETYH